MTQLNDRLDAICSSLGYTYHLAPQEFANLIDTRKDKDKPFNERMKYLLLFYADQDDIINDFGASEGATFTGQMVFAVSSSISDPSYKKKYDDNIAPMYAENEKLRDAINGCDGWVVKAWKAVQVVNKMDTNLDGLLISFKIEKTWL